ncbi:MAG: hypothetical protein ACFB5Z_00570 [Elainellaceae cyanobacterium]
MKQLTPNELREFAADIEMELDRLKQLETDIQQVNGEIQRSSNLAKLLYENLALKLHNFYTGCERVFRIIASEPNGGEPSGYDWHKRLLERMSAEREGRVPVITAKTAQRLSEYLSFRHVVRNIYGFEPDLTRVAQLVKGYPSVWHGVQQDIQNFIRWLRQLAQQLSD